MDKKILTGLIVVLVVVAGVIIARTYFEKPEVITPVPFEEEVKAVKTFSLIGAEFAFSPSEIRVNKGDQVKIILTNNGAFPHNFVVDEFNAKTAQIAPGQTGEMVFVADKAGAYEYYCGIGMHRANGMKGNLIVE